MDEPAIKQLRVRPPIPYKPSGDLRTDIMALIRECMEKIRDCPSCGAWKKEIADLYSLLPPDPVLMYRNLLLERYANPLTEIAKEVYGESEIRPSCDVPLPAVPKVPEPTEEKGGSGPHD